MHRLALLCCAGFSVLVGCDGNAVTGQHDGAVRDSRTAHDVPSTDTTLSRDAVAPDSVAPDAQPDGALATDAATRADGGGLTFDGSTTCATVCHGSAQNTAPPRSTTGKIATTERGVGAHQSHLRSSSWHDQILCSDCHKVPQSLTDPGHFDTALPAELTFSARAKSDNANPQFNGVSCTSAYCHGATLSGGTTTTPVWTKVDGSQVKCGACHSLPPTQNHVASADCYKCHVAVIDAQMKIIAPNLHINGKLDVVSPHPTGWATGSVHGTAFVAKPTDCQACHGNDLLGGSTAVSCENCHAGWQTKCTFCHGGTDNQTGAPPQSVAGQTATTARGVGQHSTHVWAGGKARYDCTVCHIKPSGALAAGHIDGSPNAEVSFSGLASGATLNTTSLVCSNVYCHGDGNGANGNATWTGSLSGGCSACHDDESDGTAMTLSGQHRRHILTAGFACSECHGCVVDAQKKIVDPQRHADGSKDFCGPSGFNATTKQCTLVCHNHQHTNRHW
ncbi:MAG: CxxxxCH/CxxCH domain-containing protein [Deltaproteobacteria bacterium]|nr:CxxxxCH/CxxCH domain-containing protein [Deltaproteobacteria bacterium]